MAIKIKKDKPVKKEYTFKEPYEFEGQTYETIELDFTGMKGKHLLQMKRGLHVTESSLALNAEFASRAAAWAANQPPEFMDEMPLDDVIAIVALSQSFLLNRLGDVDL